MLQKIRQKNVRLNINLTRTLNVQMKLINKIPS